MTFTKTTDRIKRILVFLVLALLVTCAASLTGSTVSAATSEIPITGASFPTNVSLKVGETKTLALQITPSNTTYKTNIEWGYQDNGCFSVKPNGYGTYWNGSESETITGIASGKGYLNTTVKVYDSTGKFLTDYKIRTAVTVTGSSSTQSGTSSQPTKPSTTTSIPLKSIKMNITGATLQEGASYQLGITYEPSNTTDSKSASWHSTNGSIVSVDSTGRIKCLKAGNATIYCRVGGKIASSDINVLAKPSSSSSTTTSPTTTKPTNTTEKPATPVKVTAPKTGYVNVDAEYSQINKFRTTKGVWQWKKGNKSKTYFNKSGKTYLKKLKKSARLEQVAKLRAKEIATKFSHTRPNGRSCFTAYPNYKARGENIAAGQRTINEVMNDWKETNEKYSGQGHRRNMLNKEFNAVGVACYEKNGVKYWVQAFGYEK